MFFKIGSEGKNHASSSSAAPNAPNGFQMRIFIETFNQIIVQIELPEGQFKWLGRNCSPLWRQQMVNEQADFGKSSSPTNSDFDDSLITHSFIEGKRRGKRNFQMDCDQNDPFLGRNLIEMKWRIST